MFESRISRSHSTAANDSWIARTQTPVVAVPRTLAMHGLPQLLLYRAVQTSELSFHRQHIEHIRIKND